jgi:hypothetical protein
MLNKSVQILQNKFVRLSAIGAKNCLQNQSVILGYTEDITEKSLISDDKQKEQGDENIGQTTAATLIAVSARPGRKGKESQCPKEGTLAQLHMVKPTGQKIETRYCNKKESARYNQRQS